MSITVPPTLSPATGGDAIDASQRRARLFIRPHWAGEDGLKKLFAVSFPLVMSTAVQSVHMFLDRTLLAWYSTDDFTAALQSGIMHWTLLTLLFQTVMYAGTFVAQYQGSGNTRKFGPVIWQALYIAFFGGVSMMLLWPFVEPFFNFIGHDAPLPALEAKYFKVLLVGSPIFLLNGTLSAYFNGRGRTMIVLITNAATCLLNFCLNIYMIFEPQWIFPAGIQGAGWATVLANVAGFFMLASLILAEKDAEKRFAVLSGWRFDRTLFLRILRFGFPTGVHGLIDMMGFASFMLVVGVFGYKAQLVTNMAMNVNILLFIPAIGMSAGIQIMAGQLCGAGRARDVERMGAGGAIAIVLYMAAVIAAYVLLPEQLVSPFRGAMPEAEWQEALSLAKILLLIVAGYSTFDSLVLTYSGLLKGAGDTKWVMWASIIFSQALLVWPCVTLALMRHHIANPLHGMYLAWAFCSAYIVFLGLVNVLRYRSGVWKTIKMIEHSEPAGKDAGRPTAMEVAGA